MPRARRRARTRLAVRDIQAISEVLEHFLRRGGPTAKQRRRVSQTIQKLRGVREDAGNDIASIPTRTVRHVLWSLAQVPRFLRRKRNLLDALRDRS